MKKQTFTITESDIGQRLDIFLANVSDISRSKIKHYIKDGCAKIGDKAILKPDYSLKENDEILLEIEESTSNSDAIYPTNIPLDIIYEDDDLIVLNKQAGLTVHPGAATHHDTLVNALAFHFGDNLSSKGGKDRPGIVHRLDRDTTGLMIVAKNDKVHELLSKDLAEKKIKRFYKALVWGAPSQDYLGTSQSHTAFSQSHTTFSQSHTTFSQSHPALDAGSKNDYMDPGSQAGMTSFEIRTNIDRSKSDRSRRAVCREPKGKLAITHYRLLSDYGFMSLVECQLETGRTHQIRVHMSHIGHSVVGDQTYGSNKKKIITHTSGQLQEALEKLGRQALHSYKLEFIHPISGKELKFEAPLPKDIEEILGLV